jgi:hypothetical protein
MPLQFAINLFPKEIAEKKLKEISSILELIKDLEHIHFAQGIVLWILRNIVQIIAIGSKVAPLQGVLWFPKHVYT